jgi:hypothetical protein
MMRSDEDPTPRDGDVLTLQQEWEQAFCRESTLRSDDGTGLLATEWIDLNFLSWGQFARESMMAPSHELPNWRGLARTRMQYSAMQRLHAIGLISLRDVPRPYVRLSAPGCRKIGEVVQHIRDANAASQMVELRRQEARW